LDYQEMKIRGGSEALPLHWKRTDRMFEIVFRDRMAYLGASLERTFGRINPAVGWISSRVVKELGELIISI
jgi:hypothetical protein